MTYTLAMAADRGIETAEDGVREVSMTDARAYLTRLIRAVREGGHVGSFTERGERRAYVVTPAFYEQARLDREVIRELEQRAEPAPGEEPTPHDKSRARGIRDALHSARLAADD